QTRAAALAGSALSAAGSGKRGSQAPRASARAEARLAIGGPDRVARAALGNSLPPAAQHSRAGQGQARARSRLDESRQSIRRPGSGGGAWAGSADRAAPEDALRSDLAPAKDAEAGHPGTREQAPRI